MHPGKLNPLIKAFHSLVGPEFVVHNFAQELCRGARRDWGRGGGGPGKVLQSENYNAIVMITVQMLVLYIFCIL